jgi:hypothetical protein
MAVVTRQKSTARRLVSAIAGRRAQLRLHKLALHKLSLSELRLYVCAGT